MKIEIAKVIVEACEEIGIEVDLREDYSGRGMYGSTTAALVLADEKDLVKATALAAIRVHENAEHEEFNGREASMTSEDYLQGLDFKFDSMGHDIVVY